MILGIDPGLMGGAALIEATAPAVYRLVDAIDIPVSGEGAKRRVDVTTLLAWISDRPAKPVAAFIERAQAMPEQGASSGFHYGRAVGALEAVVLCAGIPLTIIEPRAWKKFHNLGRDKEDARQRALHLFPSAGHLMARKKDHGRAEASLVALYGARLMS